MMSALPALFAGLVLLALGAEALVGGAVTIARRLSMPPLLIGITIVGFGTSMPELVVSVQAALSGSTDIALGNVIGSNIANILLIGGIAALIAPIAARYHDYRRDIPMMVIASLALIALGHLGIISRLGGVIMLAVLVAYLTWSAVKGRASAGEPSGEALNSSRQHWREKPLVALALIIIGLIGLFAGAEFLVNASISIARAFGLSEAVIGLTIVAVGTSLPELATSVAAAIRKHPEVALGNIIGSNIFNILGILGVTAIIRPLPISESMAMTDIPIMLAVAVLLALIIAAGRGIGRVAGLVLLGLYGGYVWVLL